MIPAQIYTQVYYHAMLGVILLTCFCYFISTSRARDCIAINRFAFYGLFAGVSLYIGLRPIDGVFIDMTTYAQTYELVQGGHDMGYDDPLFNWIMFACTKLMSADGFFLVCAFFYTTPLAIAFKRIHREWAFPAILAAFTAFSFFVYGVNGIRNGMATSMLILAFAFYDKPLWMALLMAAAFGLHGSVLLPVFAFIVVRYFSKTYVWLIFWTLCVMATLVFGNFFSLVVQHFDVFKNDQRVDTYILNADQAGGVRFDFLAYSIGPVVYTMACFSKRLAEDLFYRRLLNTYILTNAFWVLMMHANYSNRFAYLSWFILPWIIIYPVLPAHSAKSPDRHSINLSLIAIVLFGHYTFTYAMYILIYPMRAGEF